MKYRALKTKVVGIEPGRIVENHSNGSIQVETEPLSCVDSVDTEKDTVVITLESGSTSTFSEHAICKRSARNLMLDLMASLMAMGDPVALSLWNNLPESEDDLEPYMEN